MQKYHARVTEIAAALTDNFAVEFETDLRDWVMDSIMWLDGPTSQEVVSWMDEQGFDKNKDIYFDLRRFRSA